MKPQEVRPPDRARRRARRIGRFQSRLLLYVVIVAALFVLNAVAQPERWWVQWVALGLGLAALVQGWRVFVTPRFLRERRPAPPQGGLS